MEPRYRKGLQIDSFIADESAEDRCCGHSRIIKVRCPILSNTTDTTQNHITYDSFGQVTSETDLAVARRFGYSERELDEETG